MGWCGHVARMGRSDTVQNFCSENLKGSDVLTDMRVLWKLILTLRVDVDWIHVARADLLNVIMNFRFV